MQSYSLAQVRDGTGWPEDVRFEVAGDRPAVGDLVDALARAQGNIGKVEKSKVARIPGKDGKQGYEYHYADLADIIAAIKKPLADEGIFWGQTPVTTRDSVSVVLWFRKGEQELSFGPFTLASAGLAQAFGSATTYARRYQLSSVLGIASEDDDDAQLASEPIGQGRAPARLTDTQMKQIHALGKQKGLDHQALTDAASRAVDVESLKELTAKQAAEMIEFLGGLPDRSEPTDRGGSEPPTEGAGEPVADPGEPAPLSDLRLTAVKRYGSKTKVLKAFRDEFKPEGAAAFEKIDADQLTLLIAMADESIAQTGLPVAPQDPVDEG